MKGKLLTSVIFVCSLLSLCISLKLFWNMGIYVDEFATAPSAVYGGDFWLITAWLRLALLAISTFVSAIKLFVREDKRK